MGKHWVKRRIVRPVVRALFPGAAVVPTQMRTFTVPDAIPVTESAEGPAILLVHAGSASAESWHAVAAPLSHRFRVLRYTRPTYRQAAASTPASPTGGASTGGASTGGASMAAEIAEVLAIADAVPGHLATLRAPSEVAAAIAAFAGRVLPAEVR